jgi:IS4 transposase
LTDQLILPGHESRYTVLVIREEQTKTRSKRKRIYQTKETIEYALVTSIRNWNSKRIIKFYKKRQQVENIFREYNQSFKANKLPSHSFWGNAFYFEMISLVHNVTLFLSRNILPGSTRGRLWQAFGDNSSIYRVS